jgi:N-acetylglutamate synthase
MDINIESLERATLDAVAPSAMDEVPDWLLPFDNSTVGRAISAVPLIHGNQISTDIGMIEDRYVARGLKAQFRVAEISEFAALHAALQSSGFRAQKPTLTMISNALHWEREPKRWDVHLSTEPTEEWRSVYLANEFDAVDGANRVKALSRSKSLIYAWAVDATGPVAAGTASFSHGWASLHGLRTLARVRRKGLANALICALGEQARKNNLHRFFLQVEEGNIGAVNLYRRLGFEVAWRYHYWR